MWRSYLVILCLEIGDRTFFIAALMSAKHPAHTVFIGAFGALLVMTVLSTALGVAAPLLLPRAFTHWAGTRCLKCLCKHVIRALTRRASAHQVLRCSFSLGCR